MADVANCMNSQTPCKANFGQILSDSPDDMLSPEVREAMDRIFPQSASQFLQGGLSFEEDPFLSIASSGVDRDQGHAKPLASASSPSMAALSFMATTQATIDPAVVLSTEPEKLLFKYSLPVTAGPCVVTADSTVSVTQANGGQTKEELDSQPADLSKKTTTKNRISRADFEILSSCDTGSNECERTSRNASSSDIVSSNYNSGDGSDSEDMRRPFASITREKKKKKRKKGLTESHKHHHAKTVSYLSEHNVNSEDEFKISKSWNAYNNSAVITGSGDSRTVLENDFAAEVNKQNEMSTGDLSSKSTQGCNQSNYNSSSNGYSLDMCSVKDLYKDCVTANEDVSNTSNSSAKENVIGKRRIPCQKLPKVKRDNFHIVRHVNKIKNTFPPCFVVLRKIHTHLVYNTSSLNVIDSVLSLKDRVRSLKDLCDKGYLVCKKNRKVMLAEKLGYMNYFEEALLHGASDDEFDKPQKRSLRKRAKNISYVEPCEDDIMEEFSSKSSPVKCKDDSLGKFRNESMEKQHVPLVSVITRETEGSDNSNRYREYKQCLENNNYGICNKQQYVYPPSSMNCTSVYNPNSQAKISDSMSHHVYSQLNSENTSTIPFLSYLSGLSGGTVPGVFPHVPPVSFFPPMPLNISGSLPHQSYIDRAPFSYPVSSMGHDPQQLCLMKMNGKDVYMRLLSPGGAGAGGVGSSLPVVLPSGKTVVIPPGPSMFSQPLPQVNSVPFYTQAMFRPPVPVVSGTQGNVLTAASAQMSSLYGLPLLNRPVHSSSHSISLAALPLTSSPHITSPMNMAVVKPIPLTSYATPSSTSRQSANVTVVASTFASARATTFVTSASASTKAVPVPFASMPGPYISSFQNICMSNPASHSRLSSIPNHHPRLPTTPSPWPERLANLPNPSPQSRLPDMPNHISERLTSIPSPVSQSRIASIPSPVSQSRISSIPSPVSQSRMANIPSPVSQSRLANIPSPVSQSRIASIPSPVSQSRMANIPSPFTQSRMANIPSPFTQSRIHNIPSPFSQSGIANIPSQGVQPTLPTTPNYISQNLTNIPSQGVQPTLPTTPNYISQNLTNIPNPDLQQRLPNQPVLAYPIRTIVSVPGYSPTMESGCLATLKNSVSGSMFTPQLTATSVVLPQQKRNSDLERCEQRAAKRRRLEQKYPLPPGVVIKTESLESPPESTSVNTTSQSLLSQNSQLLSTLMPGHYPQSSEMVSPSPPNGMSVQSSRSSSWVSSLAACLGNGPPGLVPTSLGNGPPGLVPSSLGLAHASSSVTPLTSFSSFLLETSLASSTAAVASLTAAAAATARSIDTFYSNSTSMNAAAAGCHSYNRFQAASVYPSVTQSSFTEQISVSTSNDFNSIIPATVATLVQPPKASVITYESSSSSVDIAARPPPSPVPALPPSATSSRAPACAENMQAQNQQQYPSMLSPQAAALNSFRNSLVELKVFVQVQESCGLRNARLEQLKELLCKKEHQYKELQKFVEAGSTSASADRRDESEGESIHGEQRGGSETDPFVID